MKHTMSADPLSLSVLLHNKTHHVCWPPLSLCPLTQWNTPCLLTLSLSVLSHNKTHHVCWPPLPLCPLTQWNTPCLLTPSLSVLSHNKTHHVCWSPLPLCPLTQWNTPCLLTLSLSSHTIRHTMSAGPLSLCVLTHNETHHVCWPPLSLPSHTMKHTMSAAPPLCPLPQWNTPCLLPLSPPCALSHNETHHVCWPLSLSVLSHNETHHVCCSPLPLCPLTQWNTQTHTHWNTYTHTHTHTHTVPIMCKYSYMVGKSATSCKHFMIWRYTSWARDLKEYVYSPTQELRVMLDASRFHSFPRQLSDWFNSAHYIYVAVAWAAMDLVLFSMNITKACLKVYVLLISDVPQRQS